MKAVLLSGGSGQRLWPLSNDARAKQFLKVLKNRDGQLESMVQRVWRQLADVGLARSAYISTGKVQVDMLQSQLGSDVPLIIEPERRDTFPAIALLVSYLHSVERVSEDEVIVVLPVDPYVDGAFFERVKELEDVLLRSEANLALLGVNPTYPSSKYGYIFPKGQASSASYAEVSHFIEKPSEDKAAALIQENALWNCGVFSFKLGYMVNLLKQKDIPTNHGELLLQYKELPKISFDYEVVEKEDSIVVAPYNGSWKDLGTWNTLTEEMEDSIIGKGKLSNDSHNTHLINELDIPVMVLGKSDTVVAISSDGILVADKEASPRLKEMLGTFEQRPMYEERRWGWYRVLDYSRQENGQEVLTKRIGLYAGRNLSYQLHYKRSEIWTIISGEGEFVFNGDIRIVKSGDVLQIPIQAEHAIKAISNLEIIEVQMGTELVEEDIIRLAMSWDEILYYIQKT